MDDNDIKSQFRKEFGLIFRHDGDVDEERQQVTPTPEIIIGNLEQFLDRWQGKLSVRTIKAISDLKNTLMLDVYQVFCQVKEQKEMNDYIDFMQNAVGRCQ